MAKTVLLTGISGYIGLHCAKELLESGYIVRGSVRNKEKAIEVQNTLSKAKINTKNLTIVELNLNSDSGWDKAMMGCDFLMHVASPFAIANPKDPADMISPAVDGSLRALHAAKKAGIRRVILTSSIVSMMGSMKVGCFNSESWTDVDAPDIMTYIKSKTLAEKAAWDFVDSQAGKSRIELVVMAPGGVFGPPIGNTITGQSMSSLDQMLRGKLPMVPQTEFPMVDVRDVAKIHVKALKVPDASGKRIIVASEEPNGFVSMAQILKNAGYKGPSTRVAPNFLLRVLSIFDREVKGMLNLLGMKLSCDNSETIKMFDWTPITFKQSVLDAATALKSIQKKS